MANSETTIGGIVGFLRLEADQFHREIGRALAELDILDGKRVNIEVDVDKTGAQSIANTHREVDRLDGSVKRLGNSSNVSRSHMRPLTTAVLLLGQTLAPLTAGAFALGGAFVGMGAAGVLAIAGIRREMQAGTATGLAFGSAIGSAKADMQELAAVAAGNVLKPFQDSVAKLDAAMPDLVEQVDDLSTITGKAASAVAGGLLSAFEALEPLIRDAAVYVLDLSNRFEAAMSGPGIRDFGDYVRSTFPIIMQDVEAIVDAAAHLVAALAPLGLGTLGMLKALADVINALPVEVLTQLAGAASAAFIGFKTWQGLSVVIRDIATAMQFLGVEATVAASAIRGLQISAGVIGIALAGLTYIFAHNAEQQRINEQATNDYADALERTNGVIDESIEKMTAKKLADEGALEAGRELGFNLNDITQAALGNAAAQERVNAHAQAVRDSFAEVTASGADVSATYGDVGNKLDLVTGAITTNNGQLDAGIQKMRDTAAATQAAAGQMSNAEIAARTLADTYGVSMSTYQQVATNQQGIADKAAAATLQMQLENDAAGLLKQSLDLLNGEAIDVAQAQNAFDRSMVNLGKSTRDTKGKIDDSKTALEGNSEAAVNNRSQLLNLTTQAALLAEAFGNQEHSAEAGRLMLIELRQQIIDNATAQGMNTQKVQEFIDKVLKIPPTVPPTKAQLDTAEALRKKKALQDAINAITGKTVTVTIHQVFKTSGLIATQRIQNEQRLYSNGINPNLYQGGIFSGGVRKMATGDVTGRPSMIMRSTKPILWNEAPGGEAYISLAPQQRARSLAIWEQTGKHLGVSAGAAPSGMSRDDLDYLVRGFAKAVRRIPAQKLDLDAVSSRLAGDN